jgi:hypothetical protein
MVQDKVQLRDLANSHEPSAFINGEQFLNQIGKHQLLKQDTAPCR